MFTKVLPFISEFIEQLEQELKEKEAKRKLTKGQKWWLSFCLMGMMLSGRICWAEIERIGRGGYGLAALSWMFRQSKLPWKQLLHSGIKVVLKKYGISEGVLGGDDTTVQRAKITKRIYGAHKIFDKKTGGYFNGQTIVVLLLITGKITVPVGFRFYRLDPVMKEWKKTDARLKKQGVKKRPPKPAPNSAYPSKTELMIELLEEFKRGYPQIRVKAILGDALYGSKEFMKQVENIFGIQTISQLRKKQRVEFRNREMSVSEYFGKYPGVEMTIRVRGREVKVELGSARLYVKAQGQKRLIVALKYEGEKNYRYLVASDMSWRAVDVASAYTLRWLLEVFFEDWKLYEGWGQFAPQFDEEGSSRGLSLSLLLDYAFLLHPTQLARVENQMPACTVGTLQQQSRMEALIELIRGIVDADNPHKKLDERVEFAKRLFPLRDSGKHMNGRDLGRLEPTPLLRYRARACMA